MSKYNDLNKNLNESNIADLIAGLTQGSLGPCGAQPIQPTDNIGGFGNQPKTEQVTITKTENNEIKITTNVICVKLSQPIIMALKKFLGMEGVS